MARAIASPILCNLISDDQVKLLKDFNGLSALNLLDPSAERKEQVYCAMHVSLGTYHGGVVVDDISTNYPLELLPPYQNDILQGLKEHCLKVWDELVKSKQEQVMMIKK